jgi:hypothetical protein
MDWNPVSVAWQFLPNLRPCRLAMAGVSQATSLTVIDPETGVNIWLHGYIWLHRLHGYTSTKLEF